MARQKKIKIEFPEITKDKLIPEAIIPVVKTSFKLKNGQTFAFTKERHGEKYLEYAKEFAVTNKNIIIG